MPHLLSVVVIQASKRFPSLLWGGVTNDPIFSPPVIDLEVVLADRLARNKHQKLRMVEFGAGSADTKHQRELGETPLLCFMT